MLHSAEGVQLGYPFGTLLFCLAIQPIIRILHSDFRVFYLDDGTIGGSLEDVHHDLLVVEKKAALLGVQLNCNKTEFICDVASTRDSMLSAVSELQSVGSSQATLLGTPIGSADLVDATIKLKNPQITYDGGNIQFSQISGGSFSSPPFICHP